MLTMTMTQALYMAGVGDGDSDLERDLKFSAWIADRKYKISNQSEPEPGVEIIIIKDQEWKAITTS